MEDDRLEAGSIRFLENQELEKKSDKISNSHTQKPDKEEEAENPKNRVGR